jgi:hypothetical protein
MTSCSDKSRIVSNHQCGRDLYAYHIEVASHEIDGVHVCALSANFARGTVQFLASARANTQPLNRIEL